MVTRETVKLRMLDDFASLYPRATTYAWNRFTKMIGLQVVRSYEPDKNGIPHSLMMYNIDGEPLYKLNWERRTINEHVR